MTDDELFQMMSRLEGEREERLRHERERDWTRSHSGPIDTPEEAAVARVDGDPFNDLAAQWDANPYNDGIAR